eukprot:947160_1
MKGNEGYTMTKDHVKDYIYNECLPELMGGDWMEPTVKYDGLLVAFSGHGSLYSIVCSDDQKIEYVNIREWFSKVSELKQIPRLYCVDACRVRASKNVKKEMDVRASKNDGLARGGKGEAPSVTIMGHTEGCIVTGGKVSKYLCKQWNADFDANKFNPKAIYKSFGALYDAAFEQVLDETQQKLIMTEYDRRIDKVVFVPKERDRGTAQSEGTAPVIDDDLRTLLRPQPDSKVDLMAYFFVLFNADYTNDQSLCGLSDVRLAELGIEVFHRREIMKRVRALRK